MIITVLYTIVAAMELKPKKKIQALTGFEPMTSTLQLKPTGSILSS